MNKYINKKLIKSLCLISATLFFFVAGSVVYASYGTPPTAPTSLLCEGQTNPTGITDTTPECSAVFQDPDVNDYATSYQIQVNTASNFTGTSMWDSGKVASSNTPIGSRHPDISYAGSALSLDGSTYYWRIRFYDREDTTGAWSSVASFTMNVPPTAPTGLLTNGLTNPGSVESSTPYFSALFQDPDTGDYGTYYQVQVNTASDFTGTSMWDSGLLTMTNTNIGSRSPNFTYAGNELPLDGSTYYWRVRFADNYGGVGDWSDTANFAMTDDSPIERPTSCLIKRDIDNNQLLVTWEISGSDPDKFIIQRDVNSAGFTDFNTNVTASLREYLDDSTSMGNSYQYRIAMVEGADTGDWCLTPLLNLEEGDLEFTGVDVEGGLELR